VRAVGHDFRDYYGWHYPPTFLFAAAALAMLPYLVAAVVWLAATRAVIPGRGRQLASPESISPAPGIWIPDSPLPPSRSALRRT